jgi:hypothetical protein
LEDDDSDEDSEPPGPFYDYSWIFRLFDFTSTSESATLCFATATGTEAGPPLDLPKVRELKIRRRYDLKWAITPLVQCLQLALYVLEDLLRIEGGVEDAKFRALARTDFSFGRVKTLVLNYFHLIDEPLESYSETIRFDDVLCLMPNVTRIVLDGVDFGFELPDPDDPDDHLLVPISLEGLSEMKIERVPALSFVFVIRGLELFQCIVQGIACFVWDLEEQGCPPHELRFVIPPLATEELQWLRSESGRLPKFEVDVSG